MIMMSMRHLEDKLSALPCDTVQMSSRHAINTINCIYTHYSDWTNVNNNISD
jgi:hypothetical protein